MCTFDANEVYTPVLRAGYRVARKIHACGECWRKITPGERYANAAGLTEGTWWHAKMCIHCDVAARWLLRNCDGFLYGGVADDFSSHAEGNFGMLRVVVGMRKKWKNGTMSVQKDPEDMK